MSHVRMTLSHVLTDKQKAKKSDLSLSLNAVTACNYKVRLEDDSDADSSSVSSSSSSADATTWHYISDFCRNRVIAVCDFYTYARYIVQGLVKKKSDDALETFCQILRLRRNMTLARLGFEAPRDL